MKLKHLLIVCLISFSPIYFVNAQDIDTIQVEKFTFEPSIAGGQFEVTTLLFVGELGAIVDIDLFKKGSTKIYTFGTRISYESYGYLEPGGPSGGGPFKDYCLYLMHSARTSNFHINFLGGLAYHTRRNSYVQPNETLFRAGIEFRYNLINKMLGIILKGSTSFDERTTFVGLGIALGYYK